MRIFRILITLLILFIIIYFGYFFYKINKKNSDVEFKEIAFEITENQGVNDIAYQLKNKNFIESILDFEMYVFFKGKKNDFMPGEFSLNTQMSTKEILNTLINNPQPKEKQITIIEGWTVEQIANYLQEQEIVDKQEFIDATFNDYSMDFEFLKDKPKSLNLEGYLFPDTYRFYKNSSADQIIRKMLDNFNQKLTLDLKGEINNQQKSIFEIVNMASIVEKEVQTLQDKEIVSGIFWSRIKFNIALGSCATINYVTGKNSQFASLDDTEIESPYNTYKNLGLPKGPICNPGIDSLKAAIYPKDTSYMYFLTGNDGNLYYSETYEQHLRYKTLYLN